MRHTVEIEFLSNCCTAEAKKISLTKNPMKMVQCLHKLVTKNRLDKNNSTIHDMLM